MATSNRRPRSRKGSLKLVEELRQAIADSGQSQYAIIKGSGVPQPVVSRFMTGERGMNLASAAKICAYLGLHLARVRR